MGWILVIFPYRLIKHGSSVAAYRDGRSVQFDEVSPFPFTVWLHARSLPRNLRLERSQRVLDIGRGWGRLGALATRSIAVPVLLAGVFLYQVAPARAACPDSPRAGVDWTGCDKRHLHLKGEDLSAAILLRADLSRSDSLEATLRNAVLSGANLSRARFDSADLREADLSKAHAYRARFQDANLLRASLTDAVFQQADFGRANLRESNLVEANLQEATLRQANLRQDDLRRSNLIRADLRGRGSGRGES